MVEPYPRPPSQRHSSLTDGILAVTTRWDPWAGAFANVIQKFLSYWSRGSAVNLAFCRINIENTCSHAHILCILCADMPLRDFWMRLCFVSSVFIRGWTVQHCFAVNAQWVNCTCPVPSKRQLLRRGLRWQPQGEETEQETGQVN